MFLLKHFPYIGQASTRLKLSDVFTPQLQLIKALLRRHSGLIQASLRLHEGLSEGLVELLPMTNEGICNAS